MTNSRQFFTTRYSPPGDVGGCDDINLSGFGFKNWWHKGSLHCFLQVAAELVETEPLNGCSDFNGGATLGKIVLISRGGCIFVQKVCVMSSYQLIRINLVYLCPR